MIRTWNSMYFGMKVPKPMKAKTKKRLEKKLHMNSLFRISLIIAALNPLMAFCSWLSFPAESGFRDCFSCRLAASVSCI